MEVLLAHSLEEALEKLARNRRIDAVLLVGGPETERMVRAIREDNAAHPPIFVPGGSGHLPGVTTLPAEGKREMLNQLKARLEG